MRTNILRISLLISLTTIIANFAAGCEKSCTLEARSSVSVTVLDAAGAAVTDAKVQYSVDGAATKDCEIPLPEASNSFVCGEEIDGHFVITATHDTSTGTATVDVTADECHVNSQSVTIKISP